MQLMKGRRNHLCPIDVLDGRVYELSRSSWYQGRWAGGIRLFVPRSKLQSASGLIFLIVFLAACALGVEVAIGRRPNEA